MGSCSGSSKSGDGTHTEGSVELGYELVGTVVQQVLWSGHHREHQEVEQGACHHCVGGTWAFVGAEG